MAAVSVGASLAANVVLFALLAYVNRPVEARPPESFGPPIQVFVPPREPPPVRAEAPRAAAPRPAPAEPAPTPLLRAIPPPSLLPRLPSTAGIDDVEIAPTAADLQQIAVPEGPMEAAEVDRGPRKIGGPLPRYPYWARLRGLEAEVTVAFVVDTEGRVTEVQLRGCRGDRRFGDIVVRAVRRWRFEPAVYGGRRVSVRCIQTIRFVLED